jgi:hypothetical protein
MGASVLLPVDFLQNFEEVSATKLLCFMCFGLIPKLYLGMQSLAKLYFASANQIMVATISLCEFTCPTVACKSNGLGLIFGSAHRISATRSKMLCSRVSRGA